MSVHYNSFLKGNICIFCGISIKTFRWIFPCCIFLCSCKTFTVCTIPFRNVCYVKPSKMSFIIIWHIIYILNCIVCILGVTHSHYGVRHCDQIDSLYWPREGMALCIWRSELYEEHSTGLWGSIGKIYTPIFLFFLKIVVNIMISDLKPVSN